MTPVLESIHQVRPDAAIDVLVEHPFSEVLYENPFIHRLIELGERSSKGRISGKAHPSPAPLSKFQAVREIRNRRYDLAWNLHGGNTSAWMTALSRAPIRVGCRTFRNRFAYNVRVPDSAEWLNRKNHHTVERTLAWFDWLNGAHRMRFDDAPPLKVMICPAARDSAAKKLTAAGVDPRSEFVVIQPAAAFETKEWMADRFAEVADFLAARGFRIVLTGSPHEKEKLQTVKSKMNAAAAILADLTIQELAAVIDAAQLYLGNDSGPAHLAAALKRPTVVLFGSSNSVAWSPWQTRSEVVQNHYDCNPCPGYRCLKFAEPECIKSISVEQVKSALLRLLATDFSERASCP